jgi:protein tyrosine phosphatase (PTP) superfamily phosphohydrolase (DUF442 family)
MKRHAILALALALLALPGWNISAALTVPVEPDSAASEAPAQDPNLPASAQDDPAAAKDVLGEPVVEPAADPAVFDFAELPNFHRVDDKLFRGGQPAAGGLARLKGVGVRTVLNLRYEEDQSREEQAEAEGLGLNYFSVPMYGLLRPTRAQMERVLAVIDDPANQPVFVHCERGSDRTGVVVGVYRVARTGWTADEAIDEAMDLGMLKVEFAKRRYIRGYPAKQAG